MSVDSVCTKDLLLSWCIVEVFHRAASWSSPERHSRGSSSSTTPTFSGVYNTSTAISSPRLTTMLLLRIIPGLELYNDNGGLLVTDRDAVSIGHIYLKLKW